VFITELTNELQKKIQEIIEAVFLGHLTRDEARELIDLRLDQNKWRSK